MGTISDIFDRVRTDKNAVWHQNKILNAMKDGSKTARAVFEEAGENGVDFSRFLPCDLSGVHGSYLPFYKVIVLSTNSSDGNLMATAVHEARHAGQNTPKNDYPDLRTQIMLNRVHEADAMALECASAFEMQWTDPSAWQAFNREHSGIAKAYHEQMDTSFSHQRALADAFKAWFDDKSYVNKYDKNLIENVSTCSFYSNSFSESSSSETLLGAVCQANGMNYMSRDLSFLDSPRALYLSQDVYADCGACFDKFKKSYPKARVGNSLDEFGIIDKDGACREGKSAKFISNLKNILEQSPTAKAVMKDFFENDGELVFKKNKNGQVFSRAEEAATWKESRQIYVDPQGHSENNALSLFSSMHSILQPDHLKPDEVFEIKGILMTGRALKADASAAECAVCYEMKDKMPKLWQGFKRKNSCVAVAYAKTIETGNQSDALSQAFHAWYDNAGVVLKQDKETACFVEKICENKEDFTKRRPSFTILPGLCKIGGQQYMAEENENFFGSERALKVDKEIKSRLFQAAESAEKKQGTRDKSVDDLPVRPLLDSLSASVSGDKKVFGRVVSGWFKKKDR